MLVNNDEIYLNQSIDSIINQSFSDFELICINQKGTDNSHKLLKDISTKDSRIFFKQCSNNNLMNFLNDEIAKSKGDYIIILDSLVFFYPTSLEYIYKKIVEKNVDLLMYQSSTSNDQIKNNMTYLSRITGNSTFNYKKIREITFNIYDTLSNIVFKKSFLIDNKITFNSNVINGFDEFFYNSLLNAKKIFYINKQFYETAYESSYYKDLKAYEDFLDRQNNIVDLFTQRNILVNEVNNHKISKLCSVFEQLSSDIKKQAFTLLREDLLGIINSENANKFVMTLTNDNRKMFEQVIISETVEEYDLLKKIYEDKKKIYFMERYEKILGSERSKIKDFNKSLVSSNSWKLTKIFRLR